MGLRRWRLVKVLEQGLQMYSTSARVHLIKLTREQHGKVTCPVVLFCLALLQHGVKSLIVRFLGWKPSGYSGPCTLFVLLLFWIPCGVWQELNIWNSNSGSVSQGVVCRLSVLELPGMLLKSLDFWDCPYRSTESRCCHKD